MQSFCFRKVDRTGDHYMKKNKPDSKRQGLNISLIWNVEEIYEKAGVILRKRRKIMCR
jgi:hypothetical protein